MNNEMTHLREILPMTNPTEGATTGSESTRPDDHFSRYTQCDDCFNTGFVYRDDQATNDTCSCDEGRYQAAERTRKAHAYAEIPEMYMGVTFDNYEIPRVGERGRQSQVEALNLAQRFAVGDGPTLLTFRGDVGAGKTHLAVAILNHRLANLDSDLPTGKFVSVPQFLADLRAGFRKDTYQARFEEVQYARLLVLDDLGAEYNRANGDSVMSWSQEQIYLIINHRYMECLPTVVTTNVRPGMIENRIADRLSHTRDGYGAVHHIDLKASYRIGLEGRP